MTLGVMEGFIFLPQNSFKKMSDFDLSRGYLMGGEIFFEIFLQKSVNFAPLNLRISERTICSKNA